MDNYKKRGICEACGWESKLNEDDICKYCVEKHRNSLLYLYLHDMDGYIAYLRKYDLINY